MATVEIEYCVPCGFLDRALTVQRAILTGLEDQLDAVTLTMGDHGVFVVRVDDEVAFDKSADAFDPDEIARAVRERV